MAKIIDGELSGKIGDLVAYRGSRPGLRRVPVRKKPYSKAERQQQYIFGMVSSWLRPINGFLRVALADPKGQKPGQAIAISQVYSSALVRNGYNSVINPAMVQVSAGPVKLPDSLTFLKIADRQLALEWSTETDYSSHPLDTLTVLAYNIAAEEATWSFSGPARREGAAIFDLSLMPLGEFHIWAAFKTPGVEKFSNSEYLGRVNITV